MEYLKKWAKFGLYMTYTGGVASDRTVDKENR